MTLVEAQALAVDYPTAQGAVHALRGVSLTIEANDTLGVLGESGSGKSTLARALLGLTPLRSGVVRTFGHDPAAHLSRFAQPVFQDPAGSLDPRFTVERCIAEPLHIHRVGEPASRTAAVVSLMQSVGLGPELLARYPHQLSAGQRQRVCIARALATAPKLLVLDEPVSALDVTVRAQVLALLQELKRRLALTYVFISHDPHVLRAVATKVAVMYAGRIVELGPAAAVLERPRHPYTRALMRAVLSADPQRRHGLAPSSLEAPSPLRPSLGCSFSARCPAAAPQCQNGTPPTQRAAPGHTFECQWENPP